MSRLRTLLTINKNGKRVYREYSKSFTFHFMEALYVCHANILTGVPLTGVTDVMGCSRTIDGDSLDTATYTIYAKNTLALDAPSGSGTVHALDGSNRSPWRTQLLSGHQFGIVLGTDATAVTPTDSRLVNQVFHGVGATVADASRESQTLENTDTAPPAIDGSIYGIAFSPARSMYMTRIDFKTFRTGNPGNVTANVVGLTQLGASTITDNTILGTSNVVNANLWGAASPGALATFTFATPVLLQKGFLYFIYINGRTTAGNLTNIRTYNALLYAGGLLSRSGGAGTSLTTSGLLSYYPVYDIWGTSPAEMEYGGTSIYGRDTADPNDSFNISRIFRNNSGESIEINECGIYVPVSRYIASVTNWSLNNYVVCAARDVIAPHIDVADGENIEVIYTPSITV